MTDTGRFDFFLGVGIFCLGVLGLLVIVPLGVVVPDGINVRALKPSFWPNIIFTVICLTGIAVAGKSVRRHKKHKSANRKTGTSRTKGVSKSRDLDFGPAMFRAGVIVCVLLGVYFGIGFLGIPFTGMLSLVFLMIFAGERRLHVVAPIAVIVPVLLYAFFYYVASVPIPLGIFEVLL
ncbi:MAG: tripartite tricarboxylate transporter TctB family protein [Parvularculales bacterium]